MTPVSAAADPRHSLVLGRPASCALAILRTCKPAAGFRWTEFTTVAVASVCSLLELAGTVAWHGAVCQGQPRRLARKKALARKGSRGRTAFNARCNGDRAVVLARRRWLDRRSRSGLFRGVMPGGFPEQRLQFLQHGGISVIRLAMQLRFAASTACSYCAEIIFNICPRLVAVGGTGLPYDHGTIYISMGEDCDAGHAERGAPVTQQRWPAACNR